MPARAGACGRKEVAALPSYDDRERRLREAYLRLQETDRLRERLADAERRAGHLQLELDARYRELAILVELMAQGGSQRNVAGPRWSRAVAKITRLLRRWREQAGLRQARRRIRASGLFDAQWYMRQYPDVAASGIDPLEHYLAFGAREGRVPGPAFDTGEGRKGRMP